MKLINVIIFVQAHRILLNEPARGMPRVPSNIPPRLPQAMH